jgi:hypothetical protein
LLILETPSASIAAAITGSTAFFAPEICTEPLSGPLGDIRKESIIGECRKHLANIFKNREVQENSVSSILEHTASNGKNYRYDIREYHLTYFK